MFYKTFLVFLILSLNAMAANVPPVLNVQQFGNGDAGILGGVVTPSSNPDGYKTLISTLGSGDAANTYAPFFDLSTQTTDYQVPNGKTFKGSMVCGSFACTSVTDCSAMLGAGTAATTRGTTAPTGAVYWGGALASGNTSAINFNNAGAQYKNYCISMPFSFTQNTYPFAFFITASQGYVYLIGKEI